MAEHARVAFQSPAFRRFQLAKVLAVICVQMISVAVGWQVYEITGRALDLGLVGLIQFLPQLAFFPITGTVVDRFERRRVLSTTYVLYSLATAFLVALAWSHPTTPLPIYAAILLFGCARALGSPAHSAILAQLVPQDHFPNAVTWNATLWSLGAILGPAIGGGVYALAGRAWVVYAVALVGFLTSLAVLRTVHPRPRLTEPTPQGWAHFFAGVRFILNRPVLFSAITLDLFAVLLGGAVALLPIYAKDILHVGPEGLGFLRAAPSIGAATMAIFLSFHPIGGRAGAKLLASVAGFGVATIAFALSKNFSASLVALFFVGLFDEISVVIRSNISQLSTPEYMRGRVSAAEHVFIGASNEIGELESGVAAHLLGPVGAALVGGAGSIVVVLLAMLLSPSLRRVDHLTREELAGNDAS